MVLSKPVRRCGFPGGGLLFFLLAGAGWAQTAAAQCSANGGLVKFHPNGNPFGYGPAGHFKSGFATSIEMFSVNGTNRLILHENYGYTIYDLTNPLVPVSSGAQDIESVQGTWIKVGDGFSTVTTATASADGSRALVATRTIPHGTLLMKPIGAVFEFGGEFNPSAAGSLVVDHVGSRYLGYALFGQGSSTALRVADVTNFVGAPNFDKAGSIAGESVPGLRGGNGLVRAGHFLVYSTGDSIVVVNGSSPGPVSGIASGLTAHAFTMSDFGLSNTDYVGDFAAAIHPTDGKLYVMVHSRSPSASLSTGVGLGRTSNGMGMSLVGTKLTLPGAWANSIPAASGTMVPTSQDLLIFSWTHVSGSTGSGNDNKLFTWAASDWGADLTPAYVVKSTSYTVGTSSIFPVPYVMRGFSQGSQVNLYIGTGEAAFAQSFACALTITPEIYLSVNGSAPSICGGSGTGNACTVYVSDSITAYAYVNGSPDGSPGQTWSGTGATPSSGGGPTYSFGYSAPGSNTLTLNGYTAPLTMPIEVSAIPPLLLTTSASPLSAQPDQTVSFTANPSGSVGTIATTWDFGDGTTGAGTSVSHVYGAPGTYLATATAQTTRSVTGSSVTITVERVASGFYVLSPCRMLDTRDPSGPLGGPSIPAFSQRQFQATGTCGIPTTARALVANLTVVNPSTAGELRAFSGEVLSPLATVVSFTSGVVRGNNLVLRLSVNASGTLAIRNESGGAVDVILDVSGYFE